jgi:hypothetical protein
LRYTFIRSEQFYFVFSGFKIIGHGNPDNNLESHFKLIRNGYSVAAASAAAGAAAEAVVT